MEVNHVTQMQQWSVIIHRSRRLVQYKKHGWIQRWEQSLCEQVSLSVLSTDNCITNKDIWTLENVAMVSKHNETNNLKTFETKLTIPQFYLSIKKIFWIISKTVTLKSKTEKKHKLCMQSLSNRQDNWPKREEDKSGTDPSNPHDSTSPKRHRVLFIFPASKCQFCSQVTNS